MKEEKNIGIGWTAFWVGFALSFGMMISDVSKVETVLDAGLHFVLSVILSFGSWLSVGIQLMEVLR